MHQFEHPCHFCMLVLPQEGGTVFSNNMEVSSLIIYIHEARLHDILQQGAWPQIITESIFSDNI